jgi:hypothetical protein
MCAVGSVQGECQPTGFCSFPDGSCESGQRYGEFAGAGLSDECVPIDVSTGSTSGGGGSGSTSTTSGAPMTTLVTTDPGSSGITTFDVTGAVSDSDATGGTTTGMLDTTDADASTGGESSSTGEEFPAPPCADYNFGDANSAGAMLGNGTIHGDDFTASCAPSNASDVVFYWVAPHAGMYEFYADADHTQGVDVAGALWDSCTGSEQVCDDDGGDVIDSRIVVDAAAGEEFLYVVHVFGEAEEGFDMSISPL